MVTHTGDNRFPPPVTSHGVCFVHIKKGSCLYKTRHLNGQDEGSFVGGGREVRDLWRNDMKSRPWRKPLMRRGGSEGVGAGTALQSRAVE